MSEVPDSLLALAERFDPEVFDAPGGRARIRLLTKGGGEAWDAVVGSKRVRLQPAASTRADAQITADARAWRDLAANPRAGMDVYRAGRISVRYNLHVGVGFIAATSGNREEGRLRFARVRTRLGRVATMEAGTGRPVLMLHGLGGTKISFLPTVAALAPDYRTIAMDAPGFGDSDKPFGRYDAAFMARWAVALLDKLGIERADVLGHSMGGRVALELGLSHPERVECLALLAPSLAWLRSRPWAPLLRLVAPQLGVIQPAPRPIVEAIVRRVVPAGQEDQWTAAGVDEFLRSYLTPRGRAAFYSAARNIYLEEPYGPDGFWTRLPELQPPSLFVWGREDPLVPFRFARHVRKALPQAEHVELSCGHVPQLERPRETHEAIRRFFNAG